MDFLLICIGVVPFELVCEKHLNSHDTCFINRNVVEENRNVEIHLFMYKV